MPRSAVGSRWTLAEIRALAAGLIPSEASVARALLEHSQEATGWTVAELAEAAGTSPATAVRACQSLGFSGFRELQRLLLQETGAPVPPASGDLRADDSPVDVLEKVLAASVRQLQHTATSVSPSALADAVDRVVKARRLLAISSGSVAGVAAYAALHLTATGRPTEAPTDFSVQYAAAHSLREGDVLLAIANTGSSTPVVDCAKAAAEHGAAVIALTSFRRSPLTASADVSLVTGVSEQQWRTLRSSFTAMIDVLRTAVALRLGAASDELAQATAAAVPGTVVYRQSDDDQRP